MPRLENPVANRSNTLTSELRIKDFILKKTDVVALILQKR